jgi:2-oxoglutarate ferredoxin oxidoreductase subunit delta
MISIDKNDCKRCYICIEFCKKDVFGTDEEKYPEVQNGDRCNQCYFCELHCPEYAIQVADEEGNK